MKILVDDDSKVIRMFVAECVSSSGHQLEYAENGEAAVAHLNENGRNRVESS